MKLINPRGRVIEVDDHEAKDLLKRGFLHVSPEEANLYYNQVYDKGPGWESPFVEESSKMKRVLPPIGETLDTKEV